jgi:serine/threonine-protein kinase HipA
MEEIKPNRQYVFTYLPAYNGAPVSLTFTIANSPYVFDTFPPFFEGLLPE